MATLKTNLAPDAWFKFADGSGVVTAQAKDGYARVHIGSSAPEIGDPEFTFKQGEIIGPISPTTSAWVRGSGEFVYASVPAQ
jgi:hypothetical protein